MSGCISRTVDSTASTADSGCQSNPCWTFYVDDIGHGVSSLSQFFTWMIVYRSLSASVARPISRVARSGDVLTVTSLKGPRGETILQKVRHVR